MAVTGGIVFTSVSISIATAFTPDGRTMFLSVQHPSERAESQAVAVTHWPDFSPGGPPRRAVIVVTRKDGGVIGGG